MSARTTTNRLTRASIRVASELFKQILHDDQGQAAMVVVIFIGIFLLGFLALASTLDTSSTKKEWLRPLRMPQWWQQRRK